MYFNEDLVILTKNYLMDVIFYTILTIFGMPKNGKLNKSNLNLRKILELFFQKPGIMNNFLKC